MNVRDDCYTACLRRDADAAACVTVCLLAPAFDIRAQSAIARPCSISVWFAGLSRCDQCDDVLHLSQLTSSDAAAEQSIIDRCIHAVRNHYRRSTPDPIGLLALFTIN